MSPSLPQPVTLWERQLSEVPRAFSSWDNCMARSFCKYPVIAVIIVGSLIAISVIWCCVRCCCCGMNCCCSCFSCCNSCCPGPRNKKEKAAKYADSPPVGPGGWGPPPPTGFGGMQGYRSQPAPVYGNPSRSYNDNFNNNHNNAPQFATFETSKRSQTQTQTQPVNEDSLPEMPSWQKAQSRRIEDNSPLEEVELTKMPPADEQKAPMLAHQAPTPVTGDNDRYLVSADAGAGAGAGAMVAAGAYQNRAARDYGDPGNPYDRYDEHEDQQQPYHPQQRNDYYSSRAAADQSYGPGHGNYGQGPTDDYYSSNQINHNNGVAYGVVTHSPTPPPGYRSPPPAQPYGHQNASPPPQLMYQNMSPTPPPQSYHQSRSSPPPQAYPHRLAETQQSYSSGPERSHGLGPSPGPVSPPASTYSPSPQNRHDAVSPLARINTSGGGSGGDGMPQSLMPARGNTPKSPGAGYPGYTAYAPPKQQSGFTAYSPH